MLRLTEIKLPLDHDADAAVRAQMLEAGLDLAVELKELRDVRGTAPVGDAEDEGVVGTPITAGKQGQHQAAAQSADAAIGGHGSLHSMDIPPRLHVLA